MVEEDEIRTLRKITNSKVYKKHDVFFSLSDPLTLMFNLRSSKTYAQISLSTSLTISSYHLKPHIATHIKRI